MQLNRGGCAIHQPCSRNKGFARLRKAEKNVFQCGTASKESGIIARIASGNLQLGQLFAPRKEPARQPRDGSSVVILGKADRRLALKRVPDGREVERTADVRNLIEEFRTVEGDIVCARLLAAGKKPCREMVADAAGLLSDIL